MKNTTEVHDIKYSLPVFSLILNLFSTDLYNKKRVLAVEWTWSTDLNPGKINIQKIKSTLRYLYYTGKSSNQVNKLTIKGHYGIHSHKKHTQL